MTIEFVVSVGFFFKPFSLISAKNNLDHLLIHINLFTSTEIVIYDKGKNKLFCYRSAEIKMSGGKHYFFNLKTLKYA